MLNAQVLALILRSSHPKLAKGVVQIPGNELKFIGAVVEVNIEILAHVQNAIEVGQPDGNGHEVCEFVQVEIVTCSGGELGVVGFGDQFAEIDDALFLLVRERCFRVVGLIAVFPIVAEVLK